MSNHKININITGGQSRFEQITQGSNNIVTKESADVNTDSKSEKEFDQSISSIINHMREMRQQIENYDSIEIGAREDLSLTILNNIKLLENIAHDNDRKATDKIEQTVTSVEETINIINPKIEKYLDIFKVISPMLGKTLEILLTLKKIVI